MELTAVPSRWENADRFGNLAVGLDCAARLMFDVARRTDETSYDAEVVFWLDALLQMMSGRMLPYLKRQASEA